MFALDKTLVLSFFYETAVYSAGDVQQASYNQVLSINDDSYLFCMFLF